MTNLMQPEFLAVLDFEATCDDGSNDIFDRNRPEIIEIPVAIISIKDQKVTARFHAFVRPSAQPKLTAFCSELTSISQNDVDQAEPIDVVYEQLDGWMQNNQAVAQNTLYVTCGDWDLKKMWPLQTSLHPGLPTPPFFQQWCNLKALFTHHTGVKAKGMMHMLNFFGIAHEGHHHSGEDDVTNLCNITIHLLAQGIAFEPTASR